VSQDRARASSIPGKAFLLGEYAALAGLPAVVAALGPRFELHAGDAGPEAGADGFAAESPAGKLLAGAGRGFRFRDPYEGAGGFGASTAQFALAYQALGSGPLTAEAAWRKYRELSSGSGADLVAQWLGGVTLFDPRGGFHAEDLSRSLDWSWLLVFSATGIAGRKTQTHSHLAGLAADVPRLGARLLPLVENALAAIRNGDDLGLGLLMDGYAQALSREGLEAPETRADREALRLLPGVLGAKGSGARLSDAVLVLLERGTIHRRLVIEEAEKRGLRLVRDGLERREEGIQCET
jgi:mevalonate kinase